MVRASREDYSESHLLLAEGIIRAKSASLCVMTNLLNIMPNARESPHPVMPKMLVGIEVSIGSSSNRMVLVGRGVANV